MYSVHCHIGAIEFLYFVYTYCEFLRLLPYSISLFYSSFSKKRNGSYPVERPTHISNTILPCTWKSPSIRFSITFNLERALCRRMPQFEMYYTRSQKYSKERLRDGNKQHRHCYSCVCICFPVCNINNHVIMIVHLFSIRGNCFSRFTTSV